MPPPSRRQRIIIASSDEDDDDEVVIEDDDDEEEDSDYVERTPRNAIAKKRSNNRNHSSQSDSQITSASQSQEQLNEIECKRLSYLCANYFLVANCKKVPIKRSDVGKMIPKEFSRKSGIILNITSEVLQNIFGYKIVELDKKGQLILVNTLELSSIFGESMPFQVQPHESAILALRTHILIVILMSGGVVSESMLNEFVRNFGIEVESKDNHPVLGNIQRLIYQDMVRQGYLEIVHHKDFDIPFKEVKWGGRAKLELNKKEIIQFVCKIYGENIKPEMWVEQWRNALLEEGNASTVAN